MPPCPLPIVPAPSPADHALCADAFDRDCGRLAASFRANSGAPNFANGFHAGLAAGRAEIPPDTGDDSLANVRRLRAELTAAQAGEKEIAERCAAEINARIHAEGRAERAEAMVQLDTRPYASNDHAIEVGELTKQRDELAAAFAWLEDPANHFSYSIRAKGGISVEAVIPGTYRMIGHWPNLLAAITEAKRRTAEAAPRAARLAAQEARS